jgi:tRNA(Ser,Leu) C12 N-acetylase TAN1
MLTLFISFKVLRASHFKAIIFSYWYLTFPAFFFVFMAICVVLGYVDFKLKIRQKENETLSNQNPVTVKMLKDIDEIKQAVKHLTNKK